MSSTVITDVTQGFIYRPVIKSISMGRFHSGFITRDNRIFMAGLNSSGELGLSDTKVDFQTFTSIGIPQGMAAPEVIVCGLRMTAIIDSAKNLFVTGSNENGKLGLGLTSATASVSTFQKVSNFSGDVRQVAVSQFSHNTAVVTTTGELWVAGSNEYGQLGNGQTSGESRSFTRIRTKSDGTDIGTVIFTALGNNNMGVIASTSTTVKTWGQPFFCGYNGSGMLGINSGIERISGLTQARYGSGDLFPWVRAIAFGDGHSAMLTNESRLFTAGSNDKGQLGAYDANFTGTKMTFNPAQYATGGDVFVKTEEDCINNVKYLSCSAKCTLAVVSAAVNNDWKLFGCGLNDNNQLDFTNGGSVTYKMTAIGTSTVSMVATGGPAIVAVDRSAANGLMKTLIVSGNNQFGQLGVTAKTSGVTFTVVNTGLNSYIYPTIKEDVPTISVTPGYSRLRLNLQGPSTTVYNGFGVYYRINDTTYNKDVLMTQYPQLIYDKAQASSIDLTDASIGQNTPVSIQALCTAYYNYGVGDNQNVAAWLPQGLSRFSTITARTMNNNPSGLVLTPGSTVIKADWTKPASTVGVSGYRISYKVVGQSTSTQLSVNDKDSQTANITGLTSNTNYEVSIRGVDIFGVESSVIDTKTIQTLNITPGQFTSATVAQNTSITAAWTAPAQTGFANYVITLKKTSDSSVISTQTLANTVLSRQFTGLLQATEYVVELKTVDSFGTFSNVVSRVLTTGSLTPTSLVTTPDTKAIALSWTAPTNTQGLLKYQVSWKASSSEDFQSAFTSNATTTSFNITGLLPATAYSIKVFGVDGDNRLSAALAIASVTTMTFSPSNLLLSAANKTIVARWTKPSLDTYLAGYKVSWGSTDAESVIINDKTVNYLVIGNLVNGTSYTVKVYGKDNASTPNFSPEVTGSTTPNNLLSSNVTRSNNRLVYSWPAVQTSQTVSYTASIIDNDDVKTERVVEATSVEFLNLSNFKTYTFAVKASIGSSAAFDWASYEGVKPTPTAAVVPTLDRLFAGNAQITVFWTGNVVNETYKLYYGTNNSTLASTTPITIRYDSPQMSSTTPPTGSHTVMNLLNNTTYYFAITAGNSTTTETALSNVRSDVPQAALVRPDKPLGVVAVPADKSVVVSWTVAAANVNQYTIFCKASAFSSIPLDNDSSVITQRVAGTVGTFTIPNLENGSTYYISMIAENTPLKSDMTTNTTATPRPDAPGKPVISNPQNGDATSTISWGPVTNAVGYLVNLSATLNGDALEKYKNIQTTATTHTFQNLTNGALYYARVTAFNSISQNGVPSDAATVQPVETTPAAVTGLTVTAAKNTAMLTWDTNKHAKTYEVSYYTTRSDQKAIKIATTPTVLITGLSANTMYNFFVTPINGQGVRGPSSVTVSQITDREPEPAPAPAPENISVVSAPEAINITWTAVTGASSYKVLYSITPFNAAMTNEYSIRTTTTPSITINNLSPGTRYYFIVVSMNNSTSSSSASEVVTGVPAEVVKVPEPESKFITFSKTYWWVYIVAALVLLLGLGGFMLWRRRNAAAQPQI